MINFLILNFISMIIINLFKINSLKKIVFFVFINFIVVLYFSISFIELIQYLVFLISMLYIFINFYTIRYSSIRIKILNDLNNGRTAVSGTGTQTATLVFGGSPGPGVFTGATEEWNGTSWTETSDLATARTAPGSAGTTTSALSAGGTTAPGYVASTEEFTKPSIKRRKQIQKAQYIQKKRDLEMD